MTAERLKNMLVRINVRLSNVDTDEPAQMAVNYHQDKMLIGVHGSGVVLSKFHQTDYKAAIDWLKSFEDGLIVAGLD